MASKTWFITRTSTGLTEIALEKGDIVVATARRPTVLADLAAKYPTDRILALKLDVTQPSDIVAAFAAAQDKFGRIDVVVNNAGYRLVKVEAMANADVRAMFETNFWGAVNVAKQAVEFFSLREVNPAGVGGRICRNARTDSAPPTSLQTWQAARDGALIKHSECPTGHT